MFKVTLFNISDTVKMNVSFTSPNPLVPLECWKNEDTVQASGHAEALKGIESVPGVIINNQAGL